MSTRKEIQSETDPALYRKHERRWKANRYVYAVVSRRSRGISIGINLNPGKECNFRCIYCQVDRGTPPSCRVVDTDRLSAELDAILREEKSGSLYEADPFRLLPRAGRGIRDIAFSGDGEPTTSPCFERAVHIAAGARASFDLKDTKIVLITNASCLEKPGVRKALRVLDENNGEIWAKLDAGTDEYFRRINRSKFTFRRIIDNIVQAARVRSLVIQSLWMRSGGSVPPPGEIEAYCDRLNDLLESGGRLKGIQLYTIARKPSGPSVSALANEELDSIAETVRSRVPVPVEVFYGVD
jgi:wyosine [tRNA(Phe)-imidazoG37] synthetase (radical SAM superfamily)